jgi:hypothetical protein
VQRLETLAAVTIERRERDGRVGHRAYEPAPGFVTVENAEELMFEETDSLDALVDVPTTAVRVIARAAQPA